MAHDGEPIIGIDLGTTNSVVAYLEPAGRPVALPNSEGDALTPSVVYFEPSGPAVVGKEALKAGLFDPTNLVEAVKRDMGKEVFHRPIRAKFLPPAAIAGVILHRLVSDASARAGTVRRAVVTVPAYFNEPRRKSTMDAARMAGLEEVELLNEPTAAALAFGYQLGVFSGEGKLNTSETKKPGEITLLVYDLGGGTFDVTLMRIKDRHFHALVCDGDVQLGGRDWDDRLMEYAADCFAKEFDVDLRENVEAMAHLRVEAESAKKALSQRVKATMRIVHKENKLAVEITRHDLARMTLDLLGRTRLTCELALREAKLKWQDLDIILLVGGSTRMPMVSEMLSELSGIEPSRAVSPDEAVAHGAALYANMLWSERAVGRVHEEVRRRVQLAKITDVNSHSLGIVGFHAKTKQRRVSVLIPKNTPIPHSNTKVFRTKRPGQDKIYIQIVEGESSDPEHCTKIGECRLTGLPGDLPVGWPVSVTFAYRRDGRIFVEAQVKGAEPFQVEIDRKRKISEAEAESWANELIGDDEDEEKPAHKPSDLPPSKIKTAKVKMQKPTP